MPDRYSENDRRPQQGAYSNARPQGYGNAPRTAGNSQRPVNPNARPQGNGGAARPVQRLAGFGQRPQGYGSAQRPASASGAPRRPQQGGTNGQRPVNYGQRPANPNVRPQGYGNAPRAASGGAQQRRPQQRPANGAPARRPGQYGPATRPAPGNRAGQTARKALAGGLMSMSPASKVICGVLCVALLITICLAITSKIQANQSRPGISMSTGDQQTGVQQTMQPTDEPQVTERPTEQPTSVPAAANLRSATIRAIGDVIIDTQMLENGEVSKDTYDFSPLFELVGDVMGDADLTMINIEASLRKHKSYGYMGYPTFLTPHSILDDLKEVGVDMLTMCNNHALDGYYDGLKVSLDYADQAGLLHVGAYRTQEEFDTPEIYEVNGIRVGMLNYTQFTNSMKEKCDEAATIYGMRLMDGADYEGDIADLKRAGAEFVICIMHWGEEYQREPESSTKSVAKRLVAAGADLIIGGHPHVVQPAEYLTATKADGTMNSALVVYSLGNFVSEHRHEKKPYTDNGIIFDFTLQEVETGEIVLADPYAIPIYMWQFDNGEGGYDYRAVASGLYLPGGESEPVAGMSAEQYERMQASYRELYDLLSPTISVRAR